MKRDNHLDPELFDLFVTNRVYLEFARKYLDSSLIDEVDEAALIAIRPKEFSVPSEAERKVRKTQFLEAYEKRFPLREGSQSPLVSTPFLLTPSEKPAVHLRGANSTDVKAKT